jgi:hypothetical protein
VLAVTAPLAGRPRSLAGIAALLAAGQTALHMLFGLGQQGMSMTGGQPSAAMGHTTGTTGPLSNMLGTAHMPDMAGMTGTPRMAGMFGAAGAGSGSTGTVPGSGSGAAVPGMGSAAAQSGGPEAGHAVGVHALLMLPSLPMFLGHLLAAVAAGWLLRRGDLAVFRVLALSAQSVADAPPVRALRAVVALVHALRTGAPAVRPAGPRPRRAPSGDQPPPGTADLRHTVIRRGPPRRSGCALAA